MYADAKYRRLTPPNPCGQVLWWHMIAGEQTGPIPGLFRIGESAFAEQLGWPLEQFRESFGELFQEGLAKADWKARLVWIPNAIRYNRPENPNIVTSWADAWDELPECSLKVEAWQHLTDCMKQFGERFTEQFRLCCRNGMANQEQEQEQEQEYSQTNKQTNKRGLGFEDLEWEPHSEAARKLASATVNRIWTTEQKGRLKPEDRELLIKASLLAVAAPVSPYNAEWLDNAVKAAEKNKRRNGSVKNPAGYLHTCFRESATKAGRDWPADLASLESVIPAEVINPRRQPK